MRAAHRAPRRTTHRPRRAAAVRRSGRGQRDARERALLRRPLRGCGIGGRTRDAREARRPCSSNAATATPKTRALQMQRSFCPRETGEKGETGGACRSGDPHRTGTLERVPRLDQRRARARIARCSSGRAATAASAVRAGSAGSPCCRRRSRPSPRAATCATPDRRSRGTPRTVRRARREGRRDMRLHVDGERVLRAMQRRLVLLADDRCADGAIVPRVTRARACRAARRRPRSSPRRSRRGRTSIALATTSAPGAGRARPPAVPKLTMPAQPRAVASVSARSRRSARAAKTASTPSPRAMRASNAIPVTAMTGNEPVDCGATRYSPTVTRVVLSRFRLR